MRHYRANIEPLSDLRGKEFAESEAFLPTVKEYINRQIGAPTIAALQGMDNAQQVYYYLRKHGYHIVQRMELQPIVITPTPIPD